MRKAWSSSLLIFVVVTVLSAWEDSDEGLLYRRGEYAKAITASLQRISTLSKQRLKQRMDMYALLGASLLKSNRHDEAVHYGHKALEESPRDARMVAILGEAYFSLGKNEQALEQCQRYVVLDPNGNQLASIYYLIGEIYIRLGEYRKADMALSTAVYHAPHIASWWARLGYAQERGRDFSRSRVAYKKALMLHPSLIGARKGLARIEAARG